MFAAGFQATVKASIHAASVAHGERTAAAILSWSASDGYATVVDCRYAAPVGTGLWRPTPPAFDRDPLEPCWGELRPFVLRSGAECAPPPPPGFSTEPSRLYALAAEVHAVSLSLTPEQRTIARYWADGAGVSGTPPGHWMAIVGQIARADGLSLMRAAEAYARTGIAVTDAFIACWHAKYVHNLLRPVSYIQDVIDPGFRPLLATPPFPEHTSGHATQSGAAATVLADLFGERAFTDTTHSDHALDPAQAPRSFPSFAAAAEEAARSRLYGGIHYRSGNQAGLEQGACVGRTILERVRFRKRSR